MESADSAANPVATDGFKSPMMSKDGLKMDVCILCGDAELTRLLRDCTICEKLKAHDSCILKDRGYNPKGDTWRCILCEMTNNDMEVLSEPDVSDLKTLGHRVKELESMMQKLNENLSQVNQETSVLKEQAECDKLKREVDPGKMLHEEIRLLVKETVAKEVAKMKEEEAST